ncbi:MAG: DUF971 domain-containing protein [Acidobacteriota bacterium]
MTPNRIHYLRVSGVMVIWEDGHRSVFPYGYLRAHCPCLLCVSRRSGRRQKRAVLPVNIEDQGTDGIQFRWSDGHNPPPYSYELLRALCCCTQCQSPVVSL